MCNNSLVGVTEEMPLVAALQVRFAVVLVSIAPVCGVFPLLGTQHFHLLGILQDFELLLGVPAPRYGVVQPAVVVGDVHFPILYRLNQVPDEVPNLLVSLVVA